MRGKQAEDGATRVSQNGYHYTKKDGKWRLTHHLKAEEILGRPLAAGERVSFRNGNKKDMSITNLIIAEKGTSSLRRRKAIIEARIAELQAELKQINKEIYE